MSNSQRISARFLNETPVEAEMDLDAAIQASTVPENEGPSVRLIQESNTNHVDEDEALARELQRQEEAAAQERQTQQAILPQLSKPPPIANTFSLWRAQQNILRNRTYHREQVMVGSVLIRPYFIYSVVTLCTLLMGIELLVNNQRDGAYIEPFTENPLLGPSVDTLIFLGAKRTDLIVEEGDFWRLLMPIFLHGGVLHLFFNMLFLYSFGTSLESEFGHAKVAYIFILSGFFGVLCSAVFNPTIPGVGASGACYGLIGAAWADLFLNFGFYYRQGSWISWSLQLLFGTALNLALGLIPTLDNFAHIGGLLSGFLVGLSVLTLPRYDYFAEVKPDKLYQIVLKTIGIFIVPVLVVSGLSVLYTSVDVSEFCDWCELMNCVPTPWWTCGVSCDEGFTITFINSGENSGGAVITCPRDVGDITVPPPIPTLEGDAGAQRQFCVDNCLE